MGSISPPITLDALGVTFRVFARTTPFDLTLSQIETDSPNFFTACFTHTPPTSPSFSEASSRILRTDRHPKLFAILVEYLSGYDVLPLRKESLPALWDVEMGMRNLLRDADYFGLEGLKVMLLDGLEKDPEREMRRFLRTERVIPYSEVLEGKLMLDLKKAEADFTYDRLKQGLRQGVLTEVKEEGSGLAPLVRLENVEIQIKTLRFVDRQPATLNICTPHLATTVPTNMSTEATALSSPSSPRVLESYIITIDGFTGTFGELALSCRSPPADSSMVAIGGPSFLRLASQQWRTTGGEGTMRLFAKHLFLKPIVGEREKGWAAGETVQWRFVGADCLTESGVLLNTEVFRRPMSPRAEEE
ncbi:hypothetical protein T439DRAFT_377839 [Meredithblackwellia eburnea MCA 4105]